MKNRKFNKIKIVTPIIVAIILIIFISFKNNKKENGKEAQENNTINNTTIQENIIEENNTIDNELSKENTTDKAKINVGENELKDETKNEEISSKKFDNSVAFIGDSRTQGFLMYTGLKDVVDYTYIGLMVDTAVTKEFVKTNDGKKVTILQDMKTKNIDTVYIMLGVNELGWSYDQVFVKYYGNLIDEIRKVKPNCKIYLQSIIPVTKEKSDSDDIYNNNNIRSYNELIKKLAQDKNVIYLDVANYLSDNNGNLPSSASTDGIHVNKEYCLKWYEYLKNN